MVVRCWPLVLSWGCSGWCIYDQYRVLPPRRNPWFVADVCTTSEDSSLTLVIYRHTISRSYQVKCFRIWRREPLQLIGLYWSPFLSQLPVFVNSISSSSGLRAASVKIWSACVILEILCSEWIMNKSTYNFNCVVVHCVQFKYTDNDRKIIKNAIRILEYGVARCL